MGVKVTEHYCTDTYIQNSNCGRFRWTRTPISFELYHCRENMKKILLILIFCFSNTVLAENITDSKKLLIDQMLVQMGQSAKDTGKLMSNAFIEQMISALKKVKPDIDPEAFTIVEEEVKNIIDEVFLSDKVLSEMMYPIYGSRFTETELTELIEFYRTPLGKKLIRVLPEITQEGIQAGQMLGQTLAPEIERRILTRLRGSGIEI